MVAEHAAGAFVVTSGQFTDDAAAFANGKNIVLVDGHYLLNAIKHVSSNKEPILSTVQAGNTCSVCSSDMVLRTAKKGANAGNQFYGCSRYPTCRATKDL
jgi:restriction system protein